MTGRLGRVDILFEQKNAFKGIYGELPGCEAKRATSVDMESFECRVILFPLMTRPMILTMVMVIILLQ